MIVQLRRKNPRYPQLTPRHNYIVIGIEADDYRLRNDEGRPYLYPAHLFQVVDPTESDDWVTEIGEVGERYAYPPDLNANGFFEDYFDGDAKAISTFWRYMNEHFAAAVMA